MIGEEWRAIGRIGSRDDVIYVTPFLPSQESITSESIIAPARRKTAGSIHGTGTRYNTTPFVGVSIEVKRCLRLSYLNYEYFLLGLDCGFRL
jgi:hypothetical protein